VPRMLGTKAYVDFPIEEVLPYIDWNPFFQVRAGGWGWACTLCMDRPLCSGCCWEAIWR
jgi:hypothetical protein